MQYILGTSHSHNGVSVLCFTANEEYCCGKGAAPLRGDVNYGSVQEHYVFCVVYSVRGAVPRYKPDYVIDGEVGVPVKDKPNYLCIFILAFLFGPSAVVPSGLLETLFNSVRHAAIFAALIYFACAIPLFPVTEFPASGKLAASFLSPSAFAVGAAVSFFHELFGGMSLSHLTHFRDEPKLAAILGAPLLESVPYLVITVYLDVVIPKDWGTARRLLFLILVPIRWFRGKGGETYAKRVALMGGLSMASLKMTEWKMRRATQCVFLGCGRSTGEVGRSLSQ
ncbi:ATP-binding cassette protein subfamily A, member 4 [Trypanosoma rangeli]|uniref:ATP-binding cassette protein subfamily A, member 4 n=1 Tax=Trypanosoma rangeli TaxID=5698 RepID=A0A3S5IRP8_TRYRA|nr:ATP-binding cassette protein subfamily A, member 4 [Trypanosoma rangeli]RNF08067.1 ATP-binding cassette protein subfamily A, member 4 [Trypanosoma rangeli]|eukprot:RNF08067.1 ATP-binding cassette protein subfamily A, member 4 [Trypanosoma rangeli]